MKVQLIHQLCPKVGDERYEKWAALSLNNGIKAAFYDGIKVGVQRALQALRRQGMTYPPAPAWMKELVERFPPPHSAIVDKRARRILLPTMWRLGFRKGWDETMKLSEAPK